VKDIDTKTVKVRAGKGPNPAEVQHCGCSSEHCRGVKA
jgi:hypothetical protein